MYGRQQLARFFVAALAAGAVLAACSGSPSSTMPTASSGGGASGAPDTSFRSATTAERSEKRPSLAVGSHFASRDSRGNAGYYTLVTSLATDTKLNLTRATTNCDASIFEAPWYVALGDFSIAVPNPMSIPDCTGASPTPTPTPTPQIVVETTHRDSTGTQAAGTYVVQIDIGWFDLDVNALGGPATDSGGTWTFASDTSKANFQWGHIYSFFVATWTPGSTSSGE